MRPCHAATVIHINIVELKRGGEHSVFFCHYWCYCNGLQIRVHVGEVAKWIEVIVLPDEGFDFPNAGFECPWNMY
jgi:hypothetical protein